MAHRKAGICLAAALTLGLLPSLAMATVIIDDDFRYTNGNLVGQGGWQAHSGGGAKAIQVTNSTITVQQSTGSGEDDNKRWFNALSPTAKTYASFNFSVATGAVIGTATDYFAHFRPAPTDTNGFVARVHVGPGSDASHFTMGISTGSSATTPLVMLPDQFVVGQTYKVVTAFSADSGKSQLWIDPASESSPNAVSVSATVAGKPLESYAFRQASPAGATYNEVVSDVIVASTFAEVVALPKEVPSVGGLGLALLGMMLALGGVMVVRARRRAVTA